MRFSFAALALIASCVTATLQEHAPIEKRSAGIATYFFQKGNAGACGQVHKDTDFVVAQFSSIFDRGKHCGQTVHIVNKLNGKSIDAVIADECPTCSTPFSLDLSYSAFKALGNPILGELPIVWGYKSDNSPQPSDTPSSSSSTPTPSSSSSSPQKSLITWPWPLATPLPKKTQSHQPQSTQTKMVKTKRPVPQDNAVSAKATASTTSQKALQSEAPAAPAQPKDASSLSKQASVRHPAAKVAAPAKHNTAPRKHSTHASTKHNITTSQYLASNLYADNTKTVFIGGFATYFVSDGKPGACGETTSDTDYAISLDERFYSDGRFCGAMAEVTNIDTGRSVTARVTDKCIGCQNSNSLVLSKAAFDTIGPEPQGVLPVRWHFVKK